MKCAFVVALAFAAAGCGDSVARSPVAPSPTPLPAVPSPPPRGPGSGTLTIREFSPNPGATLTVSDCTGSSSARPCAEQWRSTIDVLVDREMTYAVLVVTFYDGDRLCGLSADIRDVVRAGSQETFALSSIWLASGAPSLDTNPCPLPFRTTRMEAELWSDSSTWSNTLKVGLSGEYTFRTR